MPMTGPSSLDINLKPTNLDATGALVLAASDGRFGLSIQNVGTVALAVYYTVDGSGNPVVFLPGGTVNDDGLGAVLSDVDWNGPVWLKAPSGTGRALVVAY